MARQARGKSMDPAKVQVFHTIQRCVRRAFLCGEDAVSGKSYDHRKQWIRERLEFLASIFGMDRLFGDNHKVKLGRKRSKTNGFKLSKMASGLWVSLRYFPWRKSKTRFKQLIKLGVNKRDALGAAKSGKGPWRLSRTVPVQRGLSIEFLAEQGLFNLEEYWESLHQ